MGSTGTHSGRPRGRAPASCPPSEPFWPLSSPLLTTAPTLLPLVDRLKPLVTIQNTQRGHAVSTKLRSSSVSAYQCRRE